MSGKKDRTKKAVKRTLGKKAMKATKGGDGVWGAALTVKAPTTTKFGGEDWGGIKATTK